MVPPEQDWYNSGMMPSVSQPLYVRDFNDRPLRALGAGVAGAAVFVVAAIVTGVIGIIGVGVLALAAGVVGSLTATTRLEVVPGAVTRRSRLRPREFDGSDLVLERRGDSNVFVLAPRAEERNVVCVFSDDDVDGVRTAFESAGIQFVAAGTNDN